MEASLAANFIASVMMKPAVRKMTTSALMILWVVVLMGMSHVQIWRGDVIIIQWQMVSEVGQQTKQVSLKYQSFFCDCQNVIYFQSFALPIHHSEDLSQTLDITMILLQ
jgi:hypothetical protein